MAVFAPIPRASESTATTVKLGFFLRTRKVKRQILPEGLHFVTTREIEASENPFTFIPTEKLFQAPQSALVPSLLGLVFLVLL